ncbi:hypothetical protein F5B20DRAFT_249452 [Whalleya microplaca]|nr:hypothetical protein F5B20DRAFT_249452 [Whalleya microplaca]
MAFASQLVSSPPQGIGLLDLPRGIRNNIYRQVLLADEELQLDGKHLGDGVADTHSLLLTCRTIYSEASSLLYSTNRFTTHRLQPLMDLSPSSLSSLTNLKITLHLTSTTDHPSCCRDGTGDNKPLDDAVPHNRALLSEWKSVASHISPYFRDRHLDFGFICDVSDYRTAEVALAPLRQFPILVACHIRLGSSISPRLQQLAHDVAVHLMGRPREWPISSPFRFLDLPIEIRLSILEYTDLVTPSNHVRWSIEKGYQIEQPQCKGRCFQPESPSNTCHPSAHRWSRLHADCKPFPHSDFRCHGAFPEMCKACKHYACQFQPCQREVRESIMATGCFCSRYHAAYSPLCSCWQPPTPLFLVSKAMTEDARRVFFSGNHIRVGIDYASEGIPLNGLPHHAPYQFFNTAVPASSLQYLRSLTLVFPLENRWKNTDIGRNVQLHEGWERTIRRIRNEVHLRYLKIHMKARYIPRTSRLVDIRNVTDNIWPLDTVGPMRGVDQLLFRIDEAQKRRRATLKLVMRPQGEPLLLIKLIDSSLEPHIQWTACALSDTNEYCVAGIGIAKPAPQHMKWIEKSQDACYMMHMEEWIWHLPGAFFL